MPGHRTSIKDSWIESTGVQIAIRSQELFIRQYQGQLSLPTIVPLEIAKLARELFQRNYDWKEPVRSVTVRAINLVSAKNRSKSVCFRIQSGLRKKKNYFWRLRKFGGDLEKGLSIQRP